MPPTATVAGASPRTTTATLGGSTGSTMLASVSSRKQVRRTVPGAFPAMEPWGVTSATDGSSERQVIGRVTGQPRLSRAVASRRISSPTRSGSSAGAISISSARGGETSTRCLAETPLLLALSVAVPGATAVAVVPPGSTRSTAELSEVQSTDLGGRRVPCWPRITATSMKLSPASSPAGAGRMEIPPTGRPGMLHRPEPRFRPVDAAGGAGSSTESPGATSRLSSSRSGSPSASGAAPSAAMASAILPNRSERSLASIRRIAASRSASHSARSSAGGRGGALHLRLHHGEGGALEGRRSRDHLVSYRAQSVLVRGPGDLPAPALLGAHVRRRAHQGAALGLARPLGGLGDAEVGDDGVAVLVDQDVRGLDVAMDHAGAVGVGQSRRDLPQDRAHDGQREPAGPLDHLIERAAAHVPHHEVVQPLAVAHRVDRHDVRVVQPGDGDRLLAEALGHPVAQQHRGRHHLDRDLTVEREIVGQEDRCHSASSELGPDLELAGGRSPQAFHHLVPGRGRDGHGVGKQDRGGSSAAIGTNAVGLEQGPGAHGAWRPRRPALGAKPVSRAEIAATTKTGEDRRHRCPE